MRMIRKPGKLITKIWFYMLLPTLATLCIISTVLTLFFNQFSLNTAIENAAEETAHVSSRFSDTYTYIIKRFISFTVSEEFRKDIKQILHPDGSPFSEYNNSLQDDFSNFIQIHELVSSVLITRQGGNGKEWLFYPYSFRLKRDTAGSSPGYDVAGLTGITFLPSCPSPYSGLESSIPIAVPLNYLDKETFLLISDDMTDTDIMFYLFLDTNSVHNFLKLYCSDTSEGVLCLSDGNGRIISLDQGMEEFDRMTQEEMAQAVRTLAVSGQNYQYTNGYYVFSSPVLDGGLYLINAVPESVFMQKYTYMRSIFLTIGITSFVFIAMLSILFSFFITKPLKKLMYSLRSIETDTYLGKIPITSNDEIQQLNDAIDSMYGTIRLQISRIQKEENEKYHAKMQLLSEQMNPHFLYNALEFINMEIVTDHGDNASVMISCLGNYLRIGLAYGENMLLLSKEIEHVMAYVNIMNYRFSHAIQVTTQIPEPLLQRPIVKCILQPLVENSLKHGFKVGTTTNFPFSPFITISAVLTDTRLELSVTDNGIGIDVDRAKQITIGNYTEDEAQGHVGLNNVYRRLQSCYGDVEITFSSVPFFENRVTLCLPKDTFI